MLGILAGSFVLTVTAMIYGVRLRANRERGERTWPSGHPWSGLTQLLVGSYMIWAGVTGAKQMPQWVFVLGMTMSVCWLVDGIVSNRRKRNKQT